jgi:signal peptidase I
MQCPSCRFENMPGLDSCGRCGTALGLSTATIDVNPPRASKTAKRVRKMVPRRLIYQARDVAAEARRVVSGSIVDDSRVPLPTPDVLSRLVVPGWAHIHLGMPARGQVFLLAYLPLLLFGLLYWGTGMGGILLGLAFSVHTSSVTDILIRQGTVRFPRIMAIAAFVSLALAVVVYVPAGLTLTQVAAPIEFTIDTPPFKRLDVVLVNHWAFALTSPRRGDVVFYTPRNSMRTRADQNQGLGHGRYVFEENQLIDRVIGLPGDHVICDQRKITINGEAVSWKPLLPQHMPGHLEITVPLDRYFILPTTSVGAIRVGGSESFWKDAGLIPRSEILGGVYLLSNPLSRFWFIR